MLNPHRGQLKRGKCYGMTTCQGSHQPSAASDPPRGAPDFREEGAHGDDIEQGTQRAGFGSLAVGELPIPLATIVYNTDLGLIEDHVEFARRAKRELGDALTIIHAADPRLCGGGWLMDLFIDRSRWPELIRAGYERTVAALRRLRRQPSVR